MIVGLVLYGSGNRIAVTRDDVLVMPKKLPKGVWWLSATPKIGESNVASWAGLMASTFLLDDNMSIADAKESIEKIERVIPIELRKVGVNLKKTLTEYIPFSTRILETFDEDAASQQLDKVVVDQTRGYVNNIDILDNMTFDDFMLPASLAKTKHMAKGANGSRMGFYHVSLSGFKGCLKSLNEKTRWVSNLQLAKLKQRGDVSIMDSVLISNTEYTSLADHDLLTPFKPMMAGMKKKERKVFESILIRLLINMPHRTSRHPFSMFMQAIAWSVSNNIAESYIKMGIKVLSFDYCSIQTELVD